MSVADFVLIAVIVAIIVTAFLIKKIRGKKGNGCCGSCDKCSGCK